MTDLSRLRLIGMLHLLPLPGSPRYEGSRETIRARVLHDAEMLQDAGFDALLLENYGDTPFYKDVVPPSTVAEMTAIAMEIRRCSNLPLGVQVLRNDAAAALSVAAAAGAEFIRVNVHVGAMLTDQGIIEGAASRTLRQRTALQCDVRILADVMVKHAVSIAPISAASAARDAVERGHADALIVSGAATGAAVDTAELQEVCNAVATPVYIGSGASENTIETLLATAHGAIVGTSIKEGGVTTNPVDRERALRFVTRARGGI